MLRDRSAEQREIWVTRVNTLKPTVQGFSVSQSSAKFIRCTLPYTTSLIAILILPSWQCVGPPSCLPFRVSVSKFRMHFSNFPCIPHARPSHLLWLSAATTAGINESPHYTTHSSLLPNNESETTVWTSPPWCDTVQSGTLHRRYIFRLWKYGAPHTRQYKWTRLHGVTMVFLTPC
jgi:hypothetical protein